MTASALFDKLWQSHLAAELAGDRGVLVIDRVMLHDVTGSHALREMRSAGTRPRMAADRLFAVPDHAISTAPDRGRYNSVTGSGAEIIRGFEEAARHFGIPYAAPNAPEHGIVHVVAPEQGFVAPGQTLVCGDSHTCTLGAFGALAFAVGVSEIRTVLRHQALVVKRPKTLRIRLDGRLARGISAKDVALGLIAAVGGDAAIGHVVEFAGSLLAGLDMEARLTLCNMVAEMGTRYALIAPDDVTAAYMQARGHAAPVAGLASYLDASFDREIRYYVSGSSAAGHVGHVAYAGRCHHRSRAAVGGRTCARVHAARAGHAIAVGADLRGVHRLLHECAARRPAAGRAHPARPQDRAGRAGDVHAGLDGGEARRRSRRACMRSFCRPGFSWRMPGCSACAGREGPIWRDLRVVSTTNRNFKSPGSRHPHAPRQPGDGRGVGAGRASCRSARRSCGPARGDRLSTGARPD